MKGFILTNGGIEDVAGWEVKELCGSKPSPGEGCVLFSVKTFEDLFRLCYKSQSATRVCYFLSDFKYRDLFEDFRKNTEKTDFSAWIGKKTPFRVKCVKAPNREKESLSTPDLEEKLGSIMIEREEKLKAYKPKVDLENPEITILVYLTGSRCLVGVDFSGFDMSKRAYNVFPSPSGTKGPIAYSLVRISGYKKGEVLVDCFANSGMIPIEAALYTSSTSPGFFDKEKFAFIRFKKFKDFDFGKFFKEEDKGISKSVNSIYSLDSSMKYVSFARKNAKIGGVDKLINFSRMGIEWLDIKLDKKSVDRIVTKMPHSKLIDVDKAYSEFFYQANFILKDKGRITLIGSIELANKHGPKHGFKTVDKRSVSSGKEVYGAISLSKK